MKKFLLLSLSMAFLMGCGDDDENGPSYDFIDQNLQGEINGTDFAFQYGTADEGNEELSIDLFDMSETADDPCDLFFGDYVSAFFSVPAEVGVYELSFDFDNVESSQTVTLFDPEETLNIIATEGAVEILTITETTVTGRIDARAEDDQINGNFSVDFCQ